MPLDRLRSGDFTTTLYLDQDKTHQFRYLVDGERRLNDQEADRLAPTPYPDVRNSVIVT